MHHDHSNAGIRNDLDGGMTYPDEIIRGALVPGVSPETRTCEGRTVAQTRTLYDQ